MTIYIKKVGLSHDIAMHVSGPIDGPCIHWSPIHDFFFGCTHLGEDPIISLDYLWWLGTKVPIIKQSEIACG